MPEIKVNLTDTQLTKLKADAAASYSTQQLQIVKMIETWGTPKIFTAHPNHHVASQSALSAASPQEKAKPKMPPERVKLPSHIDRGVQMTGAARWLQKLLDGSYTTVIATMYPPDDGELLTKHLAPDPDWLKTPEGVRVNEEIDEALAVGQFDKYYEATDGGTIIDTIKLQIDKWPQHVRWAD